MRWAMINQENIVENIAVWDGVTEWNPEGVILVQLADDQAVNPGDTYSNGDFIVAYDSSQV